MRALIIEDESAAAQNLRAILKNITPPIEVVAVMESIVESVEFIRDRSSEIDLIFMDIHLADGDAFKIFERIEVTKPIIFTTAYDKYSLQAFKVNSIDYLLKPINVVDLEHALSKLKTLTHSEMVQYSSRVKMVAESREETLRSFLIYIKDKIIPLKVEDVAFIYTANERVTAYTHNAEQYPVERSLDAIYSTLSSADFFRANRQYIVSRSSIRDVSVWFGSRLALNLYLDTPEKIIIPKARISEFKEWLRSQG
ncbi:MAG: LytTR family DNA-binding domain-containing protein [Rikenellaceae bacterium]